MIGNSRPPLNPAYQYDRISCAVDTVPAAYRWVSVSWTNRPAPVSACLRVARECRTSAQHLRAPRIRQCPRAGGTYPGGFVSVLRSDNRGRHITFGIARNGPRPYFSSKGNRTLAGDCCSPSQRFPTLTRLGWAGGESPRPLNTVADLFLSSIRN